MKMKVFTGGYAPDSFTLQAEGASAGNRCAWAQGCVTVYKRHDWE